MFTAATASGPKTRKAGTATVPTPAIFINSNAIIDTLQALKSQPGRIIATHWLRPEIGETANG